MQARKQSANRWFGVLLAAGWLLASSGASAIPVAPEDISTGLNHFNLGQGPYLAGGTPPNPGVDAPVAPLVDLGTPYNFIKLTGADFTVDNGIPGDDGVLVASPGFPINTASPTNALPFYGTFNITWNGTIGGDPWQEAILPFCEEADVSGERCDLMKTLDGEIKLMYVMWDVRWKDKEVTPIRDFPSVLGGFNKDSFVSADPGTDPISGPYHVDDRSTEFLPDVAGDPGLHVDHGVGVKFALCDPDDDGCDDDSSMMFNVDWFMGVDPRDLCDDCPLDEYELNVVQSMFVYLVPEPTTGALAIAGIALLALGAARRRGAQV